jgi:ribA/ribD-fused uncharacterized protein
MPDLIIGFDGAMRFLSNFYFCDVLHEGRRYRSVEHAYQAAKTNDWELKEAMAELRSPASAKKMGKLLPLRPGWKTARVDVMRQLVAAKFGPDNPYLVDALLDTKQMTLWHGNTHHDNFWGKCRCDDCRDVAQLNKLGILTEERRSELQRGRIVRSNSSGS